MFILKFLLLVTLAFPKVITCEVVEVSKSVHSEKFKNLHYVILHHENIGDLEKVSKFFRTYDGYEVEFLAPDKKIYKGVIFRLKRCFGRGLLIYFKDIKLKKHDIIIISVSKNDKSKKSYKEIRKFNCNR